LFAGGGVFAQQNASSYGSGFQNLRSLQRPKTWNLSHHDRYQGTLVVVTEKQKRTNKKKYKKKKQNNGSNRCSSFSSHGK
jgi:hypothetical protein